MEQLFWSALAAVAQDVEGLAGAPLWVISAAVIGLCMLWRLRVTLVGDRIEVARRRHLLTEVKSFIESALTANEHRIGALADDLLRAHATAYVHSLPIDELAAVHGIGARTVEQLRMAGFAVLGDLAERDVYSVPRMGAVRAGAALMHLETLIEEALTDLRMRGERSWVPRSPRVDALYREALELLDQRQTQLDVDAGELQAFHTELTWFEASVKRRSASERLLRWARELAGGLLRPGRIIGSATGLLLRTTLLAALPLLAVGWDPDLLSPALFASAATVLAVPHLWLLSWSIWADRPALFSVRRPSAASYPEQRLQFRAIQMAHELRIAPPRVVISTVGRDALAVNAVAVGRPRGPSLIAIYPRVAHECSSHALDAVLGHEMGHLAGDHARPSAAWRLLLSPLHTLAASLMQWWSGSLFRVRFRVRYRLNAVHCFERYGIASLVWLVLAALLTVPALFFHALQLVLHVASLADSRRDEFDADRTGARLSSVMDMSQALLEIEGLAQCRPQEARGAALLAERSFSSGYQQFVGRFQQLMVGARSTHPPTAARVHALESESPLVGDLLASSLRICVVAALAGAVLWYSVGVARAGSDWTRAQYVAWFGVPYQARNAEPESQDPAGFGQALEVKLGCWIRERPQLRATRVGMTGRSGPCVQRGPTDGSFYPVRCGDTQAWLHRVCVLGGGR